jgi:SAM-dependent methyltransferase
MFPISMTTLDHFTASLACPHCGQVQWAALPNAIRCARCGREYPVVEDVLDLTGACEDTVIRREREAACETERDPSLGGINEQFEDLRAVDGPLKSAILALPYGDGSKYYREPGYFWNVHGSVAAFDFLLAHLDARPGQRLLDLGADLTWSTAHMARRGLQCTAVDINHHLAAGRLFSDHYGVAYSLIRADMSRASFRDAAFDVVLAINALHHVSDLQQVASNIARVLRRGGRLAFVEPYCANEEDRRGFGAAQIEAGINEHTYLLQEWHQAFTRAGLAVKFHRICDSFAAVYEKADAAVPDLFSGFYEGALSAMTAPAREVGSSDLAAIVQIRNAGNGAWCEQSVFPVRASYHLYRVDAGARVPVSFDNARTVLPSEIEPGGQLTVTLQISKPAQPGQYVAEVDLVHEGVRWFFERGLRPLLLTFSVGSD